MSRTVWQMQSAGLFLGIWKYDNIDTRIMRLEEIGIMIMEHWLSVGAGIFLVGMMLYGHHRGFLRQCVSLGALILTIIVVKAGTPYVTGFIRENPQIRQSAAQAVMDIAGWEEPSPDKNQVPSAQRLSIEQMEIPQMVKDLLLENNNSEFYDMLGVDQFTEYVSTCLGNLLINVVGTILLFVVSFVLIHLVVRWLDLISRIPIIHGLNQMAGACLGLAQGLLFLWAGGFLLSFFSSTPVGKILEEQIYASGWLTFLYRYNLIGILLDSVIKGIF